MNVDSSIYTRYSIDYASAAKNGKVDPKKEDQAIVKKAPVLVHRRQFQERFYICH